MGASVTQQDLYLRRSAGSAAQGSADNDLLHVAIVTRGQQIPAPQGHQGFFGTSAQGSGMLGRSEGIGGRENWAAGRG